MILRPHISCTLYPTDGSDIYGKDLFLTPVVTTCAIVKLTETTERTSVRTDSSATRGYAGEITADARLLFSPADAKHLKADTKVEVMGVTLKIATISQRLSIQGLLDHFQVDLNKWVD
tara:strand:- start:1362 stop:1715 length:354 start_codon:yes stop_codon:yes gene_type:complete